MAASKKLRDAIASEMHDSGTIVGPALDGDDLDKDASTWVAGFDSPSCCVGLYCAEHSRSPEVGRSGMNRTHRAWYLVCKAGAGLAASTFHSRICAALKKGKSLDEALERGKDPGPQALRRLSLAGTRNRARILVQAAEALGITIDTLGGEFSSFQTHLRTHSTHVPFPMCTDQASGSKYRGAVIHADVSFNTLRKVEGTTKPLYQYSTCVDSLMSTGILSSSNVADRFVMFLSAQAELKHALRNDCYSAIPFSSERLKTTHEIVNEVTKAWKQDINTPGGPHPDSDWISTTFVWKSRRFSEDLRIQIEPFALWGSHSEERYVSRFSRELGIANCQVVRLRPKLVCISANDPGKLRAIVKHVEANAPAGMPPPPLHGNDSDGVA